MSAWSTPGKLPNGSADRIWECPRADGHAIPSQRAASLAGGRRQQDGSGQVERVRLVVSRPRNQRASSKVTPSVIANSRPLPGSTDATQQKVPAGVSVYW